jgi:hypothetical protein
MLLVKNRLSIGSRNIIVGFDVYEDVNRAVDTVRGSLVVLDA